MRARMRDVDVSVQIRLCRIVCIFFMMSVHVNPGLSSPSAVSTGELWWIGFAWGDILGRASVAALSFISGYLLVRTAAGTSIRQVAAKRLRSLILPFLVWNLVFCLMQLGKALLLHAPGESVLLDPEGDIVAALTGLTGPSANRSLFFLRDLFVATLLVHLSRPLLARWAWPVLAALVVVTVFRLTEPILFRPGILFFVAAGAVWAMRAPSLSAGLTPLRVAAALLVLAVFLGLVQLAMRVLPFPGTLGELANLLRRALLVVATLTGSALLVETSVARWLVPLERRIFETYLMHVPFIGMLWTAWSALVGRPMETSYVAFVLRAPVAALAAGRWLGAAIDHLPPALRMALRGKSGQETGSVRSTSWPSRTAVKKQLGRPVWQAGPVWSTTISRQSRSQSTRSSTSRCTWPEVAPFRQSSPRDRDQ